jgi:hypothetical protein
VRIYGEDGYDEDAPKGGQPGQEPAEVVAGGGEDGVGGAAVGVFEEVAAYPMFGLGVADNRFDRRASRNSRLMAAVTRRLWPAI